MGIFRPPVRVEENQKFEKKPVQRAMTLRLDGVVPRAGRFHIFWGNLGRSWRMG